MIAEYVLHNGKVKVGPYQFRTFPADESGFLPTIAVFGDMGVENHVSLDKLIQDREKGSEKYLVVPILLLHIWLRAIAESLRGEGSGTETNVHLTLSAEAHSNICLAPMP